MHLFRAMEVGVFPPHRLGKALRRRYAVMLPASTVVQHVVGQIQFLENIRDSQLDTTVALVDRNTILAFDRHELPSRTLFSTLTFVKKYLSATFLCAILSIFMNHTLFCAMLSETLLSIIGINIEFGYFGVTPITSDPILRFVIPPTARIVFDHIVTLSRLPSATVSDH